MLCPVAFLHLPKEPFGFWLGSLVAALSLCPLKLKFNRGDCWKDPPLLCEMDKGRFQRLFPPQDLSVDDVSFLATVFVKPSSSINGIGPLLLSPRIQFLSLVTSSPGSMYLVHFTPLVGFHAELLSIFGSLGVLLALCEATLDSCTSALQQDGGLPGV